jgi:NADP-reducing hydrogenase subunit HndC
MAATTTVNKQLRIATRNCGFIDPESIDDYIALRGYEALSKVLTMTPADLVELVKKSGLRGRGGGGFPTGVNGASPWPTRPTRNTWSQRRRR